MTATANIWEQVAQGKVSLALAALISHAAFAAFETIEQRLQAKTEILNFDTIRSKVIGPQSLFEAHDEDINFSKPTASLCLDGLQQCWQLLARMKDDGPGGQCEKTPCHSQLPSTIRLRQALNPKSTDKKCLEILLHDIGVHIQSTCRYCRIVRTSTPILAEVGYFLTHEESENNDLRCTYGLRLLLDAYKGYLFAPNLTCTPSSSRLKVLRFVQEVIPSISAVLDNPTMPCRCPDTLAYHMEHFLSDLKVYLTTKGFDFYLQSPWVCGSHILHILDALFYYGMRLFGYRNYLGAVVHVYNVLRKFTGLKSIEILEHISNTWGQVIFPGGLPERNFKSSYVRYMGGRLRFHRHGKHESGCHSLAIPSHTAKASAGFGTQGDPRFDCEKISFFYQFKRNGFYMDDAVRSRLSGLRSSQPESLVRKQKRCSHHDPASHETASCNPHFRLQQLQQGLSPEFEGEFPLAKINFNKIYLAIVRVVSLISDKAHGDNARPGQRCLCFADEILSAADHYRAREHSGQPFGYKGLIEICRDAMMEVLGPMKVEDCLWNDL